LSYGQPNPDKAHFLGMKAIQEMESGNIKESIKLLQEAEKLDPGNPDYPYEIAYAHYLDAKYKKSIKILTDLTEHEHASARIWQMLGNCHDMNGDPAKAIEIYETGLQKFPNSGILYLERGNMEIVKKNYSEALAFYENGILVDPVFPSNYYWASRLYLSGSESMWGIIYGEIFMNLERNSKRTVEISNLLYRAYDEGISITSDTSATISFCQQMTMNISDTNDIEKIKLPYCMVYEPVMLISLVSVDEITLSSLNKIRTNFIKIYFEQGHNNDYPNVLFDYQDRIKNEGHLEAYNHWILMKGDEAGFGKWQQSNEDKWKAFVSWFTENPIQINETNKFHTSQF